VVADLAARRPGPRLTVGRRLLVVGGGLLLALYPSPVHAEERVS
jgi:hypothetical protein